MAGGPDRVEAQRRYDRMAASYHCCLGLRSSRIARYVEGVRKRAVAALQLMPGQTVIDVGCGTGDSFSRLLAAVGPEGRVIGIDQSRRMLEVATKRIADEGWRNVALIDAAVQEAELPEADAAIFFFTHDLMRTPAALDRVAMAIRPGGRVVAAGMRRPSLWLARMALPTRRIMRRYTTTDEGLDEPWDLLAARLEGVTTESLVFGTLYIVAGLRPVSPRA